eukprot:114090-Amphidinium_carterae.1
MAHYGILELVGSDNKIEKHRTKASNFASPQSLLFEARMLGLLGRSPPFDRHDWHIDRCGHKVRYLVDFYDGKPTPEAPVSIYVDARPEVLPNPNLL